MTEKPIKHEEIFEDKVLQPTLDQFAKLIELLGLAEVGLKKIAGALGKKVNAGVDPKTISDVEALKEALEKLKRTEEGLSQLDKLKVQIREKEKKQIREVRDELKAQDGILGNLLIKQKQLKDARLMAGTKEEIKKINEELFKTEGKIKNIKEGGTNSFNSWGNALQSFQFKFNSLGATLGNMAATGLMGLLGTVADFSKEALKAGVEWAKSVGLFGESIRQAKINSEALEGELKKVEDRLNSIAKGMDVQFSAAFDSVIQTIDLKIAKTQDALDGFRPGLKGLSGDELQKVQDEIKRATDEIAQLQIERRLAVEAQYRDSFKREVEDAKKQNIEKINDEIAALGVEMRFIKANKRDRQTNEELSLQEAQSRLVFLQKLIDDLEDQSSQKQDKRRDDVKNKTDQDNKEAEKLAKESLNRQFKAFTDYWDKVDAEESKRIKDLWKEALDEMDRQAKIADEEGTKRIEDVKKRRAQDAQDTRDAMDKERQYELEAMKGQYGKVEQIIAKEEIRTKIALGTATPEEVAEYNKQIQAEDDKRLEERIKLLHSLEDAAFRGLEDGNKKQLEANKKKIQDLDDQMAFQRELALNGEANTLSELTKAKAEALAEQAALEKKAAQEARAEKLADAFLDFYKAYAPEKERAFAKAMEATLKGSLGQNIVRSLFAGNFAGGVEDFKGKGTGTSDSNIIGFSAGESVTTAAGTKATPGLVTAVNAKGFDGAADWAMKYVFPKMPVLADKSIADQVNSAIVGATLNEIKGLRKDIQTLPDMEFKENVLGEFIAIRKRQGIIETTTYKETRPSYSKH